MVGRSADHHTLRPLDDCTPLCRYVQVDISVSSSIDDVAATIAEGGGSRKLGVMPTRQSVASPPMDTPTSASKRGRNQASKCSSLLAAKLRGVSSYGSRGTAKKA